MWGTRKVAFQKGWPLIKLEINTFMFRFTEGRTSAGWPLKRGCTDITYLTLISWLMMNRTLFIFLVNPETFGELAWRSGCVIDCYVTAWWERCKNWASRTSQGTVNGGAVSKWPRCQWDVEHNQPTNLRL